MQAAGGLRRADSTAAGNGLVHPQFAQITTFAQPLRVWIRMLQEDFDEVMRGYPDSAHSMDLVAEHRLRVLHSSEAWKSLATQQSLQTSGMRGKIQQALEVGTLLPIGAHIAQQVLAGALGQVPGTLAGLKVAQGLWLAAWGAGLHPGQGALGASPVLVELPWQTAAAPRPPGTLLQRTCRETCDLRLRYPVGAVAMLLSCQGQRPLACLALHRPPNPCTASQACHPPAGGEPGGCTGSQGRPGGGPAHTHQAAHDPPPPHQPGRVQPRGRLRCQKLPRCCQKLPQASPPHGRDWGVPRDPASCRGHPPQPGQPQLRKGRAGQKVLLDGCHCTMS